MGAWFVGDDQNPFLMALMKSSLPERISSESKLMDSDCCQNGNARRMNIRWRRWRRRRWVPIAVYHSTDHFRWEICTALSGNSGRFSPAPQCGAAFRLCWFSLIVYLIELIYFSNDIFFFRYSFLRMYNSIFHVRFLLSLSFVLFEGKWWYWLKLQLDHVGQIQSGRC